MGKTDVTTTSSYKTFSKDLLIAKQPTPQDSIFWDDRFKDALVNIRNRNEAQVIQDIGRLIVPSPETLTLDGATQLKHLIETANERYPSLILPQPNFA